MNKERINYFDIAKGIGIICVIAGHMGFDTVDAIVFPFHMPLFFLISGYFISEDKGLKMYIKDKGIQLLVPYYFTCICLCVLEVLKSVLVDSENTFMNAKTVFWASIYGAGSNGCMLPAGIEQIGAIWFLWALFFSLIVVKYFINKKYSAVYIGIIALTSYITSLYIWLPLSIQAGGTATIFVYIGYLLKKHRLLRNNIFVFVSGVLIWLIEYKKGISVSCVRNYYPYGISIIAAIFICYSVIYFSKIIDNKSRLLSNVLSYYGRNSLFILCFHLIELNYFPYGVVFSLCDHIGFSIKSAYFGVFVIKILFVTVCTELLRRFISLKKCYLDNKLETK